MTISGRKKKADFGRAIRSAVLLLLLEEVPPLPLSCLAKHPLAIYYSVRSPVPQSH
jgi:hypothetical protein